MKRHLSVAALAARASFGRILAVLGGMLALDAALFAAAMRKALPLEQTYSEARLWIPLLLAYLLTVWLLIRPFCAYGSKPGYTLDRLRAGRGAVLLWQSVYNTCCFLLLWSVSAGGAYLLGCRYQALHPTGSQELFLAFWRLPLLHSLLPLDETWHWICMLLLCPSLGFACAVFGYRQRRGLFPAGPILTAALPIVGFCRALGTAGADIAITIALLLIEGISLINLVGDLTGEEAEHEA